MIVDSSALVAILYGEPEADLLHDRIKACPGPVKISVANALEVKIVLENRKNPATIRRFERLIEGYGMVYVPVTIEQMKLAQQAYREYGRGSGHRAWLNFGDCFAYALAAESNEPLLCKGDDFVHTDLRLA